MDGKRVEKRSGIYMQRCCRGCGWFTLDFFLDLVLRWRRPCRVSVMNGLDGKLRLSLSTFG